MIKNNFQNPRFERIWKIAQVDFKRRYYNDKFGLLWALINPLTQIVLYYFVFSIILKNQQENYALFLFSGLIIWLSFSQTSILGSKILLNKLHLIETVQFNWLDIYTSHMISSLFALLFNLGAYFMLLVILGKTVGSHFFLFPVILITWYLFSASFSIFIGMIRAFFEDIEHIWSLGLMIGFWVSGIFFSGTYFLQNHPWFGYLNPFVGILLNTRACLLEGNPIFYHLLVVNLLSAVILYFISVNIFKKYAKKVVEQL